MAYQVLARKWRPKTFKEMVGQEHVLRALVNALDEDRLHHAYLFTGTRGVGKTTIARIIAKSLNCEKGVSSSPCCECSTCREIDEGRFVDLIEVDAASRTKVEDTRELLENVQYAPTRGRYKVYLIDEVHMLSTSSFNALLKTLEEPPAHVKFLLATTDPQKLPATVLSRCLQFNLKRMPMDQIIAHHKHILTQENIQFEEAGLSLIARAADGSMRDSLSLLDQSIAFGHGKVTQADVATMLGSISYDFIAHIIHALSAKDGSALMAVVDKLDERAPDFLSVLNELVTILHQLALVKRIPDAVDESLMDKSQLLALADGLSEADIQLLYQIGLIGKRDLPLAPNARTGFEMVLLRMLAFTPNAGAPTPMMSSESNGGVPVKKPNAQQVSESSDAVQTTALDVKEATPAEYTPETPVADVNEQPHTDVRVDETPVVDTIKPIPEQVKSDVQTLPPQDGVEPLVEPVVIEPVCVGTIAQSEPESEVGSHPIMNDEPSAQAVIETHAAHADAVAQSKPAPDLDVSLHNQPNPIEQPSQANQSGQSRVSRRAELRAQRQQGDHTALLNTPTLMEQTVPEQITSEKIALEKSGTAQENTAVKQMTQPLEPDALLNSSKSNGASYAGVEKTEVVAPSVTAPVSPIERIQQAPEPAASDAFTPEELAVYEEYAGMTDDDYYIGYDLALDDAQPREVSEPSVSFLPPQSPVQHAVEPVTTVATQPVQVETPKPETKRVAEEAVPSEPKEPSQVPVHPTPKMDEATQSVWFELLERVNVDGLPRQLAENCALRSRTKKDEHTSTQARIELVLHSAHETLLNDGSKQALQVALSDYLGTPQDLIITVGQTSDISETPAERKTRLFGERHNHAVEAIMQDPNVMMMQSIFGARVETSSIKPIELNA